MFLIALYNNFKESVMSKFYTVDQVSELIGLHTKTVQRYIREGKLQATKVGKAWRIEKSALNDFMDVEADVEKTSFENPYSSVKVSSVVDIDVESTDEAIGIANMLTATLQSKEEIHGQTSLNIQFIEHENKVRVMLYGNIKFTEDMMSFISSYVIK
jgi:excisionase family DNA binding protein